MLTTEAILGWVGGSSAYGLALRAHITMVVVLAHFDDLPLVSCSAATLLIVIRTSTCSVTDRTLMKFFASLRTAGTTRVQRHRWHVDFSCFTATSLHTAGTTRVQSHRWERGSTKDPATAA
jgi:hypothetical protein